MSMVTTGTRERDTPRPGPDPQAAGAPSLPLTDDAHPVRSTMAAMPSLEDDLTLVAGLNERMAAPAGTPEAELGERARSG